MNQRLHLTVTASILAAALSLFSLSALSASSPRNKAIAQVPKQSSSPDGSIVINYRKFSQPIP